MKRIRHSGQSGGFSLLEAIIVSVILAVLIAVLLPALARSKRKASGMNCSNHLKQIGLAFRQWGMDNGDKYPMQVSVTNGGTMEWVGSSTVYVHFLVMSNELNTPKILFCPQESDSTRTCATTFASTVPAGMQYQIPFTNNNNISYFVGVDANETNSTMFLSGDDNFTVNGKKPKSGLLQLWTNSPVAWTAKRHVNQGNIALTDGSVQVFNNQLLRQALAQTGMATNRLAMP